MAGVLRALPEVRNGGRAATYAPPVLAGDSFVAQGLRASGGWRRCNRLSLKA
jgi:hypothetical protein